MQVYRKKFWLLLWMLCFGLPAYAVDTSLYQAEVPVASYSPADWQKALAPALQQVLVKVSGKQNVTQVPTIRKAMTRASTLVQTYVYINATAEKPLTLQVRFSPKAIDNLLQSANQSTSGTAAEVADKATPSVPGAQNTGQSVTMVVSGVAALQDYTALLDYLRHLGGVTQVDNKQARGDRVLLLLKLNQPVATVTEAIAKDNKLTKEAAAGSSHNPAVLVLRYRWVAVSPVTAAAPVDPATATPAPAVPSDAQVPVESAPAPASIDSAALTPAAPAVEPVVPAAAAPPAPPVSPPSPPPPAPSRSSGNGAPIVEGVPSPLPGAAASNTNKDPADQGQAQSFGVSDY